MTWTESRCLTGWATQGTRLFVICLNLGTLLSLLLPVVRRERPEQPECALFYSTWHSSVCGPHLASFLSDDSVLFGLLAVSSSESFSICPIPFKLSTYPLWLSLWFLESQHQNSRVIMGLMPFFLYFKNLKSESFMSDVRSYMLLYILHVHLPSVCTV